MNKIEIDPTETPPTNASNPGATRKGKIARLPKDIRDQLNSRLQDGIQARPLVDWLNQLPEVKAVMAAEFEGRLIREQNISEWRKGGYRDWRAHQETLEMVERVSADTRELQPDAKDSLADKLALWLMARHFVAARAVTDENGATDWKRVRELTRDVVALRRGDVWAERARLERERFEYQKVKDNQDMEKLFWEWAQDYNVRTKICEGFKTKAEKVVAAGKLMFGEMWWDSDEEKAAAMRKEAEAALDVAEAAKAAAAVYAASQAAKAAGTQCPAAAQANGHKPAGPSAAGASVPKESSPFPPEDEDEISDEPEVKLPKVAGKAGTKMPPGKIVPLKPTVPSSEGSIRPNPTKSGLNSPGQPGAADKSESPQPKPPTQNGPSPSGSNNPPLKT